MAKRKPAGQQRIIESYQHTGQERLNNPPAGLVTPETDRDGKKKTYAYDPHLDPQLVWAGKAEHTSFEVPTVSLHVHERIDPRTIIEAVRRRQEQPEEEQLSLFAAPAENPPIREAIQFYQHSHNWSNRLIAGDSLVVMNSLLEKEGMAGKVQMIYIDPPYGIKYGSNFQPFVNKRDVKDGSDEDLTAEPEQIQAFRDTWELGVHSYLTYLRDRFLLARELLSESGSIFVQISAENVHHVRELLDEVFGACNYVCQITYRTRNMTLDTKIISSVNDFILWYAFGKISVKYNKLYQLATVENDFHWNLYETDGQLKEMSKEQMQNNKLLPVGADPVRLTALYPIGYDANRDFEVEFEGKKYRPIKGRSWKFSPEGFSNLVKAKRILAYSGGQINYKLRLSDYPVSPMHSLWHDTAPPSAKLYVVQTSYTPIQRCLLMATDPGDLALDITCGSGTTAFVAEQWGRRWITCDTSRVAITLAKQRLMTAAYDYYQLNHPQEGVGSGFKYKTVPHITLKSIANNEPPGEETLYDQPMIDRKITRVTGPFTVEAVPAPGVLSPDDIVMARPPESADATLARSGETLRQTEWKDELLKTGIRGKSGQYIRFARLEPLPGCRYLHVDGETRPSEEGADHVKDAITQQVMRVVVSFGPEHAPLEQRRVALALEEAQTLVPKPKLVIFAAFQFDPEAAKDIDETNWPGVHLLKVQMNADLLTDDLKKQRASNESFWLIGQPDVAVEPIKSGEDKGKYRVTVQGFDYYNTKTGHIESGSSERIAVWLLDTDYDGRSLFPRQVFFPMAGANEGWARLARNLKAEIDEEAIEAYRGTVSLPFFAGLHKRIAVKIVDDRGIESLKVLELA